MPPSPIFIRVYDFIRFRAYGETRVPRAREISKRRFIDPLFTATAISLLRARRSRVSCLEETRQASRDKINGIENQSSFLNDALRKSTRIM